MLLEATSSQGGFTLTRFITWRKPMSNHNPTERSQSSSRTTHHSATSLPQPIPSSTVAAPDAKVQNNTIRSNHSHSNSDLNAKLFAIVDRLALGDGAEEDARKIEELIAQGASPSYTAMDIAVRKGHLPAVTALLKTKEGRATLSQQKGLYGTPLLAAVIWRRSSVITAILSTPEGQATVNQASNSSPNKPPLVHAVLLGLSSIGTDICIELLRYGADFQKAKDLLGPNYSHQMERIAREYQEKFAEPIQVKKAETKEEQIDNLSNNKPKSTSSSSNVSNLNILSDSSPQKSATSQITPPSQNIRTQNSITNQNATLSKEQKLARALFAAVTKGDIEELNNPIKQGIQLDIEDDKGRTPLYIAARKGHLHIVSRLLEINTGLANRACRNGLTPLYAAAWKGHIDMGIELLNHGTNFEVTEKQLTRKSKKEGLSQEEAEQCTRALNNLQLITQRHQANLAKAAQAKAEAKREINSNSPTINYPSASNNTLHPSPIFSGNPSLLSNATPHDTKENKHIKTQLPEAPRLPVSLQVNNVTETGLPKHEQNTQGDAIFNKRQPDITSKDGRRYDVTSKGGRLFCELLVEIGSTATLIEVQKLIAQGAPLNLTDEKGLTLLHHAAELESPDILQALLKGGASLSQANGNSYTPLHAAVSRRRSEIINILLTTSEGHAWANQADKSGQTPLHVATLGRFPTGVNALLTIPEGRASIAHSDKMGDTPLHLATVHCPDVVGSLLATPEGCAVASQTNNAGSTPLHLAESHANLTAINALLAIPEGRASINKANNRGGTPLASAASDKHRPQILNAFLNALFTTPDGHLLIDQADSNGRTPLVVAALHKQFDMGIELLKHDANFQKAEKWLLAKCDQKDLSKRDVEYYAQGLTSLRFIYEHYQKERAITSPPKAEIKQKIENNASVASHSNTSSHTLSSSSTFSDSPKPSPQNVLPETKESKHASIQTTELSQPTAQIQQIQTEFAEGNTETLLSHLSNLNNTLSSSSISSSSTSSQNISAESKESKQSSTQSVEVSQLTTAIQTGDSTALKKVLTDAPLEQQPKPIQEYVQSQAIWTVLGSEAKPAHKSEQITLLAEAPNVSLLVENEQHQRPIDVALEQLAEGRINVAAVQKLQAATEQQLVQENEIIFRALEEYAQRSMPTGLSDEKASARMNQNRSAADDDKPITPQQLADFIKANRQKAEALQQEFSVSSTPATPPAVHATTRPSLPPRQMSHHQQQKQRKLFKGLVHQLISERFIKGVGIGQGWVVEVSENKTTAAKMGFTFVAGTIANAFAPGLGGAAVSLAAAGVEKGYRERQKTLNRRHTLGLSSLKQMAMVTDYVERYLLHRYQDFLLQQDLLLSPEAMKTFINCLLDRMFTYLEKIENTEEIRTLLGEKLINLNTPHKATQTVAPNAKLIPTAAAQIAENLAAGTSLLSLGLLGKASSRGTDALISCDTLDKDTRELHVSDICRSPVVTLTATAEDTGLIAYEGRHTSDTEWGAGSCGVVCVSRDEAELRNLKTATPWQGSLLIPKAQSQVAMLQAKVKELEEQLAAEKARADAAESRVAELERTKVMPAPPKLPTGGRGLFDHKSLPASQLPAISQTTTSQARGSASPGNLHVKPLASPPLPVPGATPDPLSPK
jgi:ankyrin repeat protein